MVDAFVRQHEATWSSEGTTSSIRVGPYRTFGITIDPFGMNNPSYTSSCITPWGIPGSRYTKTDNVSDVVDHAQEGVCLPKGATGCHLQGIGQGMADWIE